MLFLAIFINVIQLTTKSLYFWDSLYIEAVPKTRILRIEIFDSELYGNVSHSIPSKTLYKASFRYKYNRVRQRSMVELYLNMQNKRKADGVIDIEIAQNPLKTVFITAL